jgi:hypothetical protein
VYIHKILKNEKYGTFKEKISQTFNILPERVRFWILIKRPNKTIRPDFLIPESYFDISKLYFAFYNIFKIFAMIYEFLLYYIE